MGAAQILEHSSLVLNRIWRPVNVAMMAGCWCCCKTSRLARWIRGLSALHLGQLVGPAAGRNRRRCRARCFCTRRFRPSQLDALHGTGSSALRMREVGPPFRFVPTAFLVNYIENA